VTGHIERAGLREDLSGLLTKHTREGDERGGWGDGRGRPGDRPPPLVGRAERVGNRIAGSILAAIIAQPGRVSRDYQT
jgi:hypothetical protein